MQGFTSIENKETFKLTFLRAVIKKAEMLMGLIRYIVDTTILMEIKYLPIIIQEKEIFSSLNQHQKE